MIFPEFLSFFSRPSLSGLRDMDPSVNSLDSVFQVGENVGRPALVAGHGAWNAKKPHR